MLRIKVPTASLALTAIITAGCGGDTETDTEQVNTDYSQLKWEEPVAEPLAKADHADQLVRKIKNGIRLRLSGSVSTGDLVEPAESPTADVGGDPSYSQTNVHTLGVEEADRVKYDGEYLYIAEEVEQGYAILEDDAGGSNPDSSAPACLRVLKTLPDEASAIPVAEVELAEGDASHAVSDLYLLKNTAGRAERVAVLSRTYRSHNAVLDDWTSHWVWQDVRLDVLDVTAPEYPSVSWSLDIEGWLQDSRLIGDVLYLVTYHYPSVEGINYSASTQKELRANERLIAKASTADLLPQYRQDEGQPVPLVDAANCYTGPEGPNELRGVSQVVTVSAFDLRRRQLLSSSCITAPVSSIYASVSNLYLAASWYDTDGHNTSLHKFSLNKGQIGYEGAGTVPGQLASWANPGLRMHEHEGYLRIVTTEGAMNGELKHRLSVLRNVENSTRLEIVAMLPNAQRPAPIGKPNEEIYAVRFLDDRAYIVTFRRIDPLYVLDLTDQENPYIAGELEIPGLSDYLHPIGGDYVVSVGLGADASGVTEGVKIELFDTRDITNPQSLGRHHIGGSGSRTAVAYDLRAFNFVSPSEDVFRFAIPAMRYDDWTWVDTGLHAFEVSGLTAEAAELSAAGAIIVDSATPEKTYPLHGYNDRARFHEGTLFYVHGNAVWSRFWDSPSEISGPF